MSVVSTINNTENYGEHRSWIDVDGGRYGDRLCHSDRIFNEIREGGGSDVVNYIIDLEGNKRGVYYAVSDKG